jgi:hypothetical protein
VIFKILSSASLISNFSFSAGQGEVLHFQGGIAVEVLLSFSDACHSGKSESGIQSRFSS